MRQSRSAGMSAGKRARVSSALHSELSEYSSLLRALRTSNTLDLALQLTTHATTTHHSDEDVDVEPIDDEDGESELPLTDEVALSQQSTVPYENSSNLDVSRQSQRKLTQKTAKADSKRSRDTWTRWPLLSGDVHVPEWSLEDEVALLATQCLNAHASDSPLSSLTAELPNANDFTSSDQPHDLEHAESSLTPHALHALTESTARYLSQILALLAAYVPSAEESMQNRVRPLDWENVLAIIGTNGLLDPDSLESMRERLLTVYSSSPRNVIHKYPQPKEVKVEDLSFLAIDGYDPSLSLTSVLSSNTESSRPRKKRKTRTTS